MNRYVAALVIGLGLLLAAYDRVDRPSPSDLVGTWRVDLRPTPESEPYFQEFIVSSVEGDSLQGSFYGSPIERGLVNTSWGRVEFAFVTSDGSGVYNHSGRLENDLMEGSTYSLGRAFLLPWRAQRRAN